MIPLCPAHPTNQTEPITRLHRIASHQPPNPESKLLAPLVYSAPQFRTHSTFPGNRGVQRTHARAFDPAQYSDQHSIRTVCPNKTKQSQSKRQHVNRRPHIGRYPIQPWYAAQLVALCLRNIHSIPGKQGKTKKTKKKTLSLPPSPAPLPRARQ